MDEETAKRAEEIAELREQQKMTFKAIGEKYQIPAEKASRLYQDFLRYRRIARYWELHEKQNQMTVMVKMTLGELVVLQRILNLYQAWVFRESSHRTRKENPLFQEPDSIMAEHLIRRFSKMEREKRQKINGIQKPIDFSSFS